jgi:hypothetical protein
MSGARRVFEELPGWFFELDEVSAGVCKVLGIDEIGRSIELTGTSPDLLLDEAKKLASKMSKKSPN